MNNQASFVFILVLSAASAAIVPLSANYLEGPSTKTRVVGPDGSVIDAFAPGGRILLEGVSAVPLAPAAPVVLSSSAVAQPAEIAVPLAVKSVELSAPVLPLSAAVLSVPAPVVPLPVAEIPSPVVAKAFPAKIVGLSAQEPAAKIINVPVEARNSENLVEESTTATESTAEEATTLSSGDESGQYVPDNSEKLYDDGSYKPEQQS